MHAFVLRPRLPRLAALLMALTLLVGFQQPVADDRADAADLSTAPATLSSLLRIRTNSLKPISGQPAASSSSRNWCGWIIVGAEGGSGVLGAQHGQQLGPARCASPPVPSACRSVAGIGDHPRHHERRRTGCVSARTSVLAAISQAAGPVGHGVRADLPPTGGDIIAFSAPVASSVRTLEGAALTARNTLNAYYDAPSATPYEIAIERRYHNVAADPLIQSLP